MKTLVCIMQQVRNGQWDTFKPNVLDHLKADLALCVSDAPPKSLGNVISGTVDQRYYEHAKYKFIYKEPESWETAFDEMDPSWRDYRSIPGNWLGPTSTHEGSGGINAFFRWFLYQHIKDLDYDRVIITRSDYVWREPHPDLDNEHVWVPNGEFHGGICDRHMVIPRKFWKEFLVVPKDPSLFDFYKSRQEQSWMMNNESYIWFMYSKQDLMKHVGFFPFVMHVDGPKYPGELETHRQIIVWPYTIDHSFLSHGYFQGRIF